MTPIHIYTYVHVNIVNSHFFIIPLCFSHTLNIRRKWWGIRLYVLRFFPQQHFFSPHKLPLNICFPHLLVGHTYGQLVSSGYCCCSFSVFFNGMAFSPHRQVDQQVRKSKQELKLQSAVTPDSCQMDSRALLFCCCGEVVAFSPCILWQSESIGANLATAALVSLPFIQHFTISTHLLLCSGSVLSPKKSFFVLLTSTHTICVAVIIFRPKVTIEK